MLNDQVITLYFLLLHVGMQGIDYWVNQRLTVLSDDQ